MKNFKKVTAAIAATLMAATMVAPMALNASAVDEKKTTITMSDSDEHTSFKGYQLLTATVTTKETEEGNQVIDSIAYSVSVTYREILKEVTGKNEDDDIIEYIGELDSEGIRAFADAVYAKITASMDADITTEDASFEDVEHGYYLIVEDTPVTDGTVSKVMLDTAGLDEIKVNTKKAGPTFTKKIADWNDSEEAAPTDYADITWTDSADHDKFAKDAVPFKLTATLPSDYADYKEYFVTFHDNFRDVNTNQEVFELVSDSVEVYVGETKLNADDYKVTIGTDTTLGECDFEVKLKNLKVIAEAAKAGDEVVVYYKAKFTDNAVIGQAGNWNDAYLEYTNNPYQEVDKDKDGDVDENEEEETSETPKDTVVAFTYKTVINKTDKSDNALAGAEFTLSKKYVDADAAKEANGGVDVIADENGAYWVKIATTEEITENTTSFEFAGLDDGTYMLVESKVPAGYNGVKPMIFDVTATHAEEVAVNATGADVLTELNGDKNDASEGNIELKATVEDGKLESNIVNQSGSELPSTGSIGTTLFYLGGGAMVAVAGIFLITKKRMGKDEA